MPYEKAPSSGAFLPASLMYFLSGEPMHYLSGVDSGVSVRLGTHDKVQVSNFISLR
jgi:hypothetical protein